MAAGEVERLAAREGERLAVREGERLVAKEVERLAARVGIVIVTVVRGCAMNRNIARGIRNGANLPADRICFPGMYCPVEPCNYALLCMF